MKIKYSLIIVLVVFIIGCYKTKQEIPTPRKIKGEQELEKFSMVETVQGKKQWELEAAQAQVFEIDKKTLLEKIRLKFYKDNQLSSTLIAEKGYINTETGDMEAEDKVRFFSEQQKVTVETDKLYWDNTLKKIVTDSFVRQTREDGVITGYGMEAEPDLSKVIIKNQVKGEVTNPGEIK